jgi:hypothetical protein
MTNMTGDACCASRGARPSKGAAAASLLPAIAGLFAPKCPVCLAAYLSLAGLGGGVASVAAPLLLPVGIASTALLVLVVIWRWRRARRHGVQAAS